MKYESLNIVVICLEDPLLAHRDCSSQSKNMDINRNKYLYKTAVAHAM